MTKELISLIVPCYNEGEVLYTTYEAVEKVMEEAHFRYELIFINDGSRDTTLKVLRELAKAHREVRYISFSRNFGKEAAMLAGLRACRGDCAVIMDADLQHPPEMIPCMYEIYKKEGYHQVIARRNRKGDAPFGTLCAKVYYKLVNKLVDVEMADGAGDFRLLSRKAVEAVLSLKENNRFSKGLFSWIGFRSIYLDYENQERAGGTSKWSFHRLLTYGIDGILSFNNKPLRFCIYLGTVLLGISILYLLYLFVQILLHGIDVPGYFTTILAITLLGGAQLISIGIIGEYIGRIYYEVKGRPSYIVEETNMESEDQEE